MPSLVPYLKALNRKERFYLVAFALGNEDFRLGDAFRQELSDVLDLPIPTDAFVAMDYHLDWLFVSIELLNRSGAPGPHPRALELIKGNQEDIDLLIAFDTETESHVIMVEAKGVTSYSNAQFASKVRRLSLGFAASEPRLVVPHFILVSPRPPQRLLQDCPKWMLDRSGNVRWLRLPIPTDLQKVVRSTEDGKPSKSGGYWTMKPERTFGHPDRKEE